MTNAKDKIAKLGKYTAHPINLYKILSEREYALLEFIRFRVSIGELYISNSLLHLEMGFAKASTIKQHKDTLSKLGFIKIVEENKNMGTKYAILCDNICGIVSKLNSTINPIERLKLADKYRTEHGLEAIHTKQIELFENTYFDYSDNRYIENNDIPTYNDNNKQTTINKLNDLHHSFISGEITKREYDIRTDKIISENKNIKFNTNIEKWILM